MFTHSFIRKFLSAAASVMMFASLPIAGASAAEFTRGDINCDGNVNDDDLALMSQYLAGRSSISKTGFSNADMDGDSNVDSIDLIKLRKFLSEKGTGYQSRSDINSAVSASIYNPAELYENGEFINAPLSDMNGSLKPDSEGKVCIFYVDFPDCPFKFEPTTAEIRQMAFADEEPESINYPHESMNAFFQRSSKHRFSISGDVFRYTAKNDKAFYEKDTYKVKLIDEIISSLDDSVDFSEFDGNKDGVIDSVIVCVPEAAGNAEWWSCAHRYAGSLHSVVDDTAMGYVIVGNAEIKGRSDYENFAASYIHELGHCMGLPDYYLYGQRATEGLHGSAGYDTMDELYTDFSCVSKLMLGWYKDTQIQVYDYDGGYEQTFNLTDGQSEYGNCLIIPYNNELADDYSSEYLIIEYTTLNNNNEKIPDKYWWLNYGNGIRIFHVLAATEEKDGVKELLYTSEKQSFSDYFYGRRFVRVVNDSNIDNLYRTGKIITHDVKGFAFYGCAGDENVDPGVEIYVGELKGDSYNITIRRKAR